MKDDDPSHGTGMETDMKNNLYCQTSEYDCGPTTLMNAIRFLFDRAALSPDLIKAIHTYTLDAFDDKGECGKNGTSRLAMTFLSYWFNEFGKTRKFPIQSEMMVGDQVIATSTSRIASCLQQGGVAIVCCWLDGYRHYVLLTGLDEAAHAYSLFDPYDSDEHINGTSIRLVEGEPKVRNRSVSIALMNQENGDTYALGESGIREAMLLYNSETRILPEKSIEFFI